MKFYFKNKIKCCYEVSEGFFFSSSPNSSTCGCYKCRSAILGSDAVESARKEIALGLPEGIAEWRRSSRAALTPLSMSKRPKLDFAILLQGVLALN